MTKIEYEEKALELRKITGKTPGEEFVNESHIALAIFLIEAQIDPEEEIDPLWIIGHIFQAGKIEGIRKERARRKRLG